MSFLSMSNLSQINMPFRPADVRLLLKTNELAEFRFWMTRRFVKGLWRALVNCLASNEVVIGQTQIQAKKTVLTFQHESAVAQSNFESSYDSVITSTPLGDKPLLLIRANLKRNETNQPVLGLHQATGQGIELAIDGTMLHSFCKLIAHSVDKSGWDMKLGLGSVPIPSDPANQSVN